MKTGSLFSPRIEPAVLRPYQAAAIDSLRAKASAKKTRLLLTIPTGGGKTLTAANLIRSALKLGRRVLFVVHLRELVDQTVRALERCGVTDIGVMRGDDGRVDPDAPVQIASIQTLARRKRPEADVVLLDEAHRSISDGYVKHIWEAYPDAIIIGLTATPCRGDGRPLGERYQELIVAATYSELIADGFVADPLVVAPRVEPNTSRVRKVAGDWNEADLEEVMGAILGDIVPTWREHADGLKTICFASGINHSKDIVRRFLEAGVSAEHLDGTTSGLERAAILARLESGETTVVSNCAVLTEGFDMPAIRCAILARPTLSLVLHMQTSGRALRPGSVRPVILDHAGNVGRHGMPHEDRIWSIDGPAKRAAQKNPYRTCKKCFAYFLASQSACPHCGFEVPALPKELPKELAATMRPIVKADVERDFYRSAVNLAQSRGFKPGMASFKFKEKFGRWPPWAWSQETKREFEADTAWQVRLAQRTEWREQRERSTAGAADGNAAMAIEPVEDPASYLNNEEEPWPY